MIRLPVGQLADGQPAYTLYMALSIDFHLHYINDLKNKLIMTASLISMMIIFIVLFAVYKGHEPIRSVSRRIQNITSKDLDVRLDPQAVPIELERLVLSFNHMLERIEDVFTRQSNFSADIAHEIRTPITNLVTQTEIALSQTRSQKELEDVLYSNLEEFGRMSKMVSDMLFLAQADNNQLIPEKKALDLADEVHKVFDFLKPGRKNAKCVCILKDARVGYPAIPSCYAERSATCCLTPCATPRKAKPSPCGSKKWTDRHRLPLKTPAPPLRQNIYRACLTASTGLTLPDSVKAKAAELGWRL